MRDAIQDLKYDLKTDMLKGLTEKEVRELNALRQGPLDYGPGLNNHTLRFEWDRRDRHQIEEAKTFYRKAKREGRRVIDQDGNPVTVFRSDLEALVVVETELKPDEFAVHVLDETGDRRLIWNAEKPEEIEEASKLFGEYIKRGWKAYGTRPDGTKSRRIRFFDPVSQEIFFDDKPDRTSLGTKLKDFVASFKEVKMIPKSRPG